MSEKNTPKHFGQDSLHGAGKLKSGSPQAGLAGAKAMKPSIPKNPPKPSPKNTSKKK